MTDEQIQQLQEYASALLTPSEIAILLDIPPNERSAFCVRCRTQTGTAEYEAFQRGRLATKLALRRNVIKLAKAGSPIAEQLAEKFLQEQNIDR